MKALFLGDLCPTEGSAPYFKKDDKQALFGDMLPLFQTQDFCFVNVECALTEAEQAIRKIGPPLKAPPETAAVLGELGVTVCGISNNHIFDYGKKGAKDTVDAIRRAGMAYTGFAESYDAARQDYVFSFGGERLSLIAVCEHEYSYALEDRMGARPFDEYDTLEDIRKARETNDKVVVLYHGGKEQCRYPSPRLYKACHAMARAGADMILCQHSHAIGCYEKYENCHILYGQGNFHFLDTAFGGDLDGWESGLAVCYDTKTDQVELVPIVSNQTGVELAKGSEKETILSDLRARNAALSDGSWKKGWHDFCMSVAEGYREKLILYASGENHELYHQFVAHYLDCEAHTDVMRELYSTYNLTNEK